VRCAERAGFRQRFLFCAGIHAWRRKRNAYGCEPRRSIAKRQRHDSLFGVAGRRQRGGIAGICVHSCFDEHAQHAAIRRAGCWQWEHERDLERTERRQRCGMRGDSLRLGDDERHLHRAERGSFSQGNFGDRDERGRSHEVRIGNGLNFQRSGN